MRQRLEAGTTIIVDRYAFSGVAFTAAKEVLALAGKLLCVVRVGSFGTFALRASLAVLRIEAYLKVKVLRSGNMIWYDGL